MRHSESLLLALALVAGGCNPSTTQSDVDGSTCHVCASSSDCSGGEQCVRLSSSSVCAAPCLSNSSCASADECVSVEMVAGGQTAACLARNNSCGAGPGGTSRNDGGVQNEMDAGNGTFDAGGATPALTDPLSSGGPVTSNLTPQGGGTMDRLLFAVVGDTRPATVNDPGAYPTTIINGIYNKLASLSPQPAFVIATGDYAYADPGTGTASPQYTDYLSARAAYKGILWPVMGNHECDGSTTSNCFPGSGSSMNIDTWIPDFLKPISEALPYYERDVNATNGSWTAKFIFLAPNSWNAAQQTFLTQQLARKSTYTFVIRHEPSLVETAGSTDPASPPGTAPIDASLKAAGSAVTAVIEGHSHTWYFYDYVGSGFTTQAYPKEIIVGNGGAPMTSTTIPYGFTIISQRLADNAIVLGNYDYTTGAVSGYYYAITATGDEIQYQQ